MQASQVTATQAHMSALWTHPVRNGAVLGFLGGGLVASLASFAAGVTFDALDVPFTQPWVRDLSIALIGAATGAFGFNIAFEILRCCHNPNAKNVNDALQKQGLLNRNSVDVTGNSTASNAPAGGADQEDQTDSLSQASSTSINAERIAQQASIPLHKASFFYFLVAGFLAFTSLVFSSETLINKMGLWAYHGTIMSIKAVLALALTQSSRCAGIPSAIANTLTSVVGTGLLAEQASDILMSTLLKDTFDNISGTFVGIGLSVAFGLAGSLLGRAILECMRATAQAKSTSLNSTCGNVILGLAGAMKNAVVCGRRPAAPPIETACRPTTYTAV